MPIPTISTNFLWVLNPEQTDNWSHFVNSWSRLYAYPDLEEFSRLIQKEQLEAEEIEWLYRWKNGMNLSGPKQLSITNDILSKRLLLNQLRINFSLTAFKVHFFEISAIWQVFLLHILQPSTFPIFDQHVYRSYCYLTTGQPGKLPLSEAKRMGLYHKDYLPFFNQIAMTTIANRHTIDQALWAFGKFIKHYPSLTIHDYSLPAL